MKRVLLFTLIFFTTIISVAQNVPTTDSILTAAYKQATAENKNVFVIFRASWCGWCKKMDASMNDASTKRYFDENYITVHLNVQESPTNKQLENSGAAEYLQTLKGSSAGLPFFVVLNKSGKLLGDSFVKNENLGCPASEAEVAAFISLISKTSSINKDGLKSLTLRFRLN